MFFFLLFYSLQGLIPGNSWAFNVQRVSSNSQLIIHKLEGDNETNVMVQTRSQYNSLQNFGFFFCEDNRTIPIHDFVSIHYVNQTPAYVPIEDSGTYYFSLYSCGKNFTITRIVFGFHNSWGYLFFEFYPCIYISWIEVGFYLILFILLLINACRQRGIAILLNWIIIGSTGIQMVCCTVAATLYLLSNMNESSTGLQIAANVMSCVRTFILIVLSLFLASGLSIVYEKLPWQRIVFIIVSSAIFAVFEFLIENIATTGFSLLFEILVYLVYCILFILYAAAVYYLARKATETLSAHLVMIASYHIDPVTTPSFKKRDLLEMTKNCAICILFIVVLFSILFRIGLLYYFITFLVNAIAIAVCVGIISYQCRVRKAMSATYGDDEDAYVVDDIESQQMKPWEYGMTLPPMPVESYPQNKIHPGDP